jgi:hypothetical protein
LAFVGSGGLLLAEVSYRWFDTAAGSFGAGRADHRDDAAELIRMERAFLVPATRVSRT